MDTRDAGLKRGPSQEEPIREPRVGWVVGTGAEGSVQVDYPGNTRGPVTARVSAALDSAMLARAAEQRQQALLMFENGDPGLPIIVTLLAAPSATPMLDAVLEEQTLPEPPEEVVVDGERVVLRGEQEVVLQCGRASITLRRDGKIVLRGSDILTVASGVQRIKGGKVQIN